MNKFREIFRGKNGDLSSKRVIGTIMIGFGIAFGAVCLILPPLGIIDDSVLVFTGSLFTGGLGLLGLSVAERKDDAEYHPNNISNDDRIRKKL